MRVAALICCLLSAVCCLAKNGAYRSTPHGDPVKGPHRRADRPRGSCGQCHDTHGGLFAPNDNNLCFTCHSEPSWSLSAHANAPSEGNKCVDCHEPHGNKDGNGLIPSMLRQREAELCVQCHDGSHGADIKSQLNKPYVHGRKVACSDCHNVHQAFKDPALPFPPQASSRLAGVSRVEVVNGSAGVVPAYRLHGPNDGGTVNEFEICFKCHSSYVHLGPGRNDLALLTNPANASFHPIQSEGKNRDIDPSAFTGGMNANSIIRCTDCHRSDDDITAGMHGSSYPYLLKKPADELCFDCHTREVYTKQSTATRFNEHALHAVQNVACLACHETHGSVRKPALIAINNYIQSTNGGTCSPACHAFKTYTINYRR